MRVQNSFRDRWEARCSHGCTFEREVLLLLDGRACRLFLDGRDSAANCHCDSLWRLQNRYYLETMSLPSRSNKACSCKVVINDTALPSTTPSTAFQRSIGVPSKVQLLGRHSISSTDSEAKCFITDTVFLNTYVSNTPRLASF